MNLNFWHRSLLAGDDRQHKLSTRDADERSGTILASIPIVIHISYCQPVKRCIANLLSQISLREDLPNVAFTL